MSETHPVRMSPTSNTEIAVGYSYHEAIELTVTRAEAKAEIDKHDWDGDAWAQFVEEVGDREEYEGEEVLGWLGY